MAYPIQNYNDLLAAIPDFLLRSDLTPVIPGFISLAEAQMNRRLRVRRMVERDTATLMGEFIALPASFGGPRTMQLTGVSPIVVVQYVEPTEAFIQKNKYYWVAGQPVLYTVVGEEFQFVPPPDTSYALELTYWKRLQALGPTNLTNWLITDHPDAYLYGSLVQAAPYLMDDPRLTTWGTLFTSALSDIEYEDSEAQYAGRLNQRLAVVFGGDFATRF